MFFFSLMILSIQILYVVAVEFLKLLFVCFSEIKDHCKKNLENRETDTGETMDTS